MCSGSTSNKAMDVAKREVVDRTTLIIDMYCYFILADIEEMITQTELSASLKRALMDDVEDIVISSHNRLASSLGVQLDKTFRKIYVGEKRYAIKPK